ncbi:hypothetical protein WICPIJ_003845 [Wickerhamomyces pijperi]|uniref:Uncharacterized protein n=1 Tax=Wickerhamomyces pijperi TaxID=599730 RepID=A0A9P8Q979_WICPI|nr:hypothetical protein WICPIJ_003845 [Wickerhamomyces pijperi]
MKLPGLITKTFLIILANGFKSEGKISTSGTDWNSVSPKIGRFADDILQVSEDVNVRNTDGDVIDLEKSRVREVSVILELLWLWIWLLRIRRRSGNNVFHVWDHDNLNVLVDFSQSCKDNFDVDILKCLKTVEFLWDGTCFDCFIVEINERTHKNNRVTVVHDIFRGFSENVKVQLRIQSKWTLKHQNIRVTLMNQFINTQHRRTQNRRR